MSEEVFEERRRKERENYNKRREVERQDLKGLRK